MFLIGEWKEKGEDLFDFLFYISIKERCFRRELSLHTNQQKTIATFYQLSHLFNHFECIKTTRRRFNCSRKIRPDDGRPTPNSGLIKSLQHNADPLASFGKLITPDRILNSWLPNTSYRTIIFAKEMSPTAKGFKYLKSKH